MLKFYTVFDFNVIVSTALDTLGMAESVFEIFGCDLFRFEFYL